MKTVKEIVKEYLVENGFDGLASEDCGCDINDFTICENDLSGCVPAVKIIKGSRKCKEIKNFEGTYWCIDDCDGCYVPAEKGRGKK